MKLFIAGFPNDFDDTDLKDMFELYGAVTSAKFVTDRMTGKSKGFGFIDMPDNAEAMETIGSYTVQRLRANKYLCRRQKKDLVTDPEIVLIKDIETLVMK